MSNMQIDGVLAQIRSLQALTRVGSTNGPNAANGPAAVAQSAGLGRANGVEPLNGTSFASVLKAGLDKVNAAQQNARSITEKFERGVPGVELSQVMIESQKANVAFRATVEVRNRLVNAYQEIMNMPI
ncbi:MAG: hypothetical protein RLZZ200_2394 [Pseudomonadota bacterium]|jgi:flagellar hook-basal body complex protein FliE